MSSIDASYLEQPNPIIGVCQLTCTVDKDKNFQISRNLIEKAKNKGAKVIFLPEAVDYIGESKQQSIDMAEDLNDITISKYQDLAKQLGVWISVGGFHQKVKDEKRVLNTHVMIDNTGEIKSTYNKTHLFDLDIPGKVRLCESDYTVPGDTMVSPVETPVGKVGLSICYDLRFPEMSTALAKEGADILTYPSAFTVPTGMAHWEVLLRSRAIETQCYVVAAAQTGKHNEKRQSYGHAMVVDPWGTVIAQCREGTDVCVAEIDLSYLKSVRANMPIWSHRRPDLYGEIQNLSKSTGCSVDNEEKYQFGHFASLRPAERLCDLSPTEISDLFNTVQTVSNVIKKHFNGTSLTVAVQDGKDAGQTVMHVHVHILPRREQDIPNNDDIYHELEKHDKVMLQSDMRSEEEMEKESSELRKYFNS
ncbi:NIT1 [Mytilus coruscus]|uniref:Nitrilase and fragile histidine triad fusion protein NitFhit n=1 Tax=Mytilus coruscus TaxID=42192 RepID=A0A6J8D639_MYTCO|nr:NIT1 [Mytilus coruscus]